MADAQNILRDAITRIPVWTGDGKDTFTPVQWLARVEKARTTAAWTDAQTMSFVYVSLRGEALLWFDVLKRSGIQDTFEAFQDAFLTSYAPARTARTATVNLHEIKQGAGESIVTFYSRVISAVNDLEQLIPAETRAPDAAVLPAEIVALAGFAALPEAARQNTAQGLVNMGITIAINHMGLQLFVAGLRPTIRDEMMKNMPDSLWTAFQTALNLEKIHATPKNFSTSTVNEIAEEEGCSDQIDGEIDAIQAQLGRLQARKSQYNNKRPQNYNGAKQNPAKSNSKDVVVCRICNKKGHYQTECFTRIRRNMPCVDKNGAPLRTQPPKQTLPPYQGRVNEISSHEEAPPPHAYQQPPPPQGYTNGFAPPQQGQGYWTPMIPNFQ